MNLKTAFAILLLLPSKVISEGAFGIEFGSQMSDFVSLAEVDGLYKKEPKKPSKSFATYAVIYEPSLGLCKITVNTVEYSDGSFRKSAVQEYNLLN